LSEDHKPELFEENKRVVAAGGYGLFYKIYLIHSNGG
jgi:hypothetical protein